jgi:hypothetical protein
VPLFLAGREENMNESRFKVWFEIFLDLVFRTVMNVITFGGWERFEASRAQAFAVTFVDGGVRYEYGDAVDRGFRDLFQQFVRFVIGVVSIATIVYRFKVPQKGVQTEDLFKDWGHALVFTLFGMGLIGWWYRAGAWKLFLWLAAALTAAEVIAFVIESR